MVALAFLDARQHLTEEDWELAGRIGDKSNLTRRAVQAQLAQAQKSADMARGQSEGTRTAVAQDTVEKAAVQRIARRLLTRLQAAGPEGKPRGKARKNFFDPRDREYFDDAVEHLVGAGQIKCVQQGRGAWLKARG